MRFTSRLRSRRTVVYSFFLLVAIALLGSCGMPFDWSLDLPSNSTDDSSNTEVQSSPEDESEGDVPANEEPESRSAGINAIYASGQSFTLSWDPPTEAVDGYRLYQRSRGTEVWTILATGLPTPEATITSTQLSYGEYEFAVSSVGVGGMESDIHTSLDETADPASGWYLVWSE